MPNDGDAPGGDQPDGDAGVTRGELAGMLEGMMGAMMSRLAESQEASLSALRRDLTAQISEGAAAAASGGRPQTAARAAVVAATASDPNAAFAAQRAAEAKAAQDRVARQVLAAKLQAEYEAKMVAAG